MRMDNIDITAFYLIEDHKEGNPHA